MHHLHPGILNAVAVPYSFDEAVNNIKYGFVLWLLYLRSGTCHSDLTNFVCQLCCRFIMSLMNIFLLPRNMFKIQVFWVSALWSLVDSKAKFC